MAERNKGAAHDQSFGWLEARHDLPTKPLIVLYASVDACPGKKSTLDSLADFLLPDHLSGAHPQGTIWLISSTDGYKLYKDHRSGK